MISHIDYFYPSSDLTPVEWNKVYESTYWECLSADWTGYITTQLLNGTKRVKVGISCSIPEHSKNIKVYLEFAGESNDLNRTIQFQVGDNYGPYDFTEWETGVTQSQLLLSTNDETKLSEFDYIWLSILANWIGGVEDKVYFARIKVTYDTPPNGAFIF